MKLVPDRQTQITHKSFISDSVSLYVLGVSLGDTRHFYSYVYIVEMFSDSIFDRSNVDDDGGGGDIIQRSESPTHSNLIYSGA